MFHLLWRLAQGAFIERRSTGRLDLKESLQPPDLEHALADEDAQLEDAPPLHAGVGAFGGVSVGSFANDDIALLVLDLS